MTIKLKSRPDAIGKMIGEAVSHLPDATMAFYTLVTARPDARPPLAEKLHTIETTADERYITLIRKVADTFITPYDRDDLYRMIEALDDVIDALDGAGQLLIDFDLDKAPKVLVDSARELVGMSEQARDAVDVIKKPRRLEKILFAINDHENRLDANYRQLVAGQLRPGCDPLVAMKWKILADEIEAASTNLDAFARTLAVAAIKET